MDHWVLARIPRSKTVGFRNSVGVAIAPVLKKLAVKSRTSTFLTNVLIIFHKNPVKRNVSVFDEQKSYTYQGRGYRKDSNKTKIQRLRKYETFRGVSCKMRLFKYKFGTSNKLIGPREHPRGQKYLYPFFGSTGCIL